MDCLRHAISSRTGGKILLEQLEELELPEVKKNELVASICRVFDVQVVSAHGALEPDSRSVAPECKTSVMSAVVCIAPRGKHDLLLCESNMLMLRNPKIDLKIPVSDIEAVVVLDNIPKDKKGRILILLHLKRGKTAAYNKQNLSNIVFQVSSDSQLDIAHPTTSVKMQGPAVVILCQLLGAAGVPSAAFIAPSDSVFKSAAGHNSVEAIMKVNQGVLFPLPRHLVFLERPQIFVPLTDIQEVDFARVSGMSQTFDMHVHLREGNLLDFSQIPQNEAYGLQQYMTKQGVALSGGPSQPVVTAAEPAAAEDSDSDSEEDSDFDPDRSSESEGEADPTADGNSKDQEAELHTAGSSSSEDDEDESEDDVELFSDEDVPASKVRELVTQEEAQQKSKKRRKQ